MLEYLVVALIVAVAAWYAASRYLPKSLRAKLFGKKKAAGGCGSGCSSCGTCDDAPAPPSAPGAPRVIPLHRK